MKIIYGSPREKAFLCCAYLLAAAATTGILLREQLISLPYVGLPLYLVICAIVLFLLPVGQRPTTLHREGPYRFLPAVFLMGAILHASSFTFPAKPSVAVPDVFFHFVEFFALGFLTARMVAPGMGRGVPLRSFLLAFSIVLGFGLTDEIYQGFVPGRDPDWADLLVDAVGGFLGILVYPHLLRGPSEPS